ncbi:MAG: hypothetical protein ABI867_17575 [Kofleriaceae bacterium]
MTCPKCQQDVLPSPVGFTWWGGLIGSKIINHVQCPSCGGRFNGRTGGDNTAAITIYMIVVGVLAFGLMYFVFKG